MKISVEEKGHDIWVQSFFAVPRVGELIVKDEAYLKVEEVIHGGDDIFVIVKCCHRDVYQNSLWEDKSDDKYHELVCKRCGTNSRYRKAEMIGTGTGTPNIKITGLDGVNTT